MLYGTVEYGFKAGGSLVKEFAVRAELVKEEGDWKMRLYQVYLVSVIFALIFFGGGGRRALW